MVELAPLDGTVETAFRSDKGRRSENQDRCGEFARAGAHLVVVADGMGGHRGGQTASRLAVEAIGEAFARSAKRPSEALLDALVEANRRVHEAGQHDLALHGMGTTAVALVIDAKHRGWVAHVGDSRAYRLRAGRLERLTEDHSWLARQLRDGTLSPAEARDHPARGRLMRTIGREPGVEVDLSSVSVRPGDRFLLCSDGLWGALEESEIAERLAVDPLCDAARGLVDAAIASGASDNVSVHVLHAVGSERPSRRGLVVAAALFAVALFALAFCR